jgi:hypothetical protein
MNLRDILIEVFSWVITILLIVMLGVTFIAIFE